MAIYASLSTITTQTIPLIIVDTSIVAEDQILQWDPELGAFVAREFSIPDNSIFDFSKLTLTGELGVVNGGTGLNSIQPGSLLIGGNTPDKFTTIPQGISNNRQVLSIQNGEVGWEDITNISGNQAHISDTFDTSTITLPYSVPAGSYISQITITISTAYNAEASISLADDTTTLILLPPGMLTASLPGVYIFKFDEYIMIDTELVMTIQSATQGSGKITVEYNRF